ncbi:MAG: carboxypeptidase-like regulatory domain-containing protein [Gemmatimonadales bacterium]
MRERSWLGSFARAGAVTLSLLLLLAGGLLAQGVTTGQMGGFVLDVDGNPIVNADVVARHEPTGTTYGTSTRGGGAWTIPNMRIGGPYTITATMIGYQQEQETGVYLDLGQNLRLDLELEIQAVEVEELAVQVAEDKVLNAGRTGAATYVSTEEVEVLPALRRTFRDLTRVDPRADENMAFGGRNWLYNNISLDGSYFNNAFGLDDPVPGGQTASEPIPFTAIAQVSVQIAPFDIRQGGFTGANVNLVSKSGTNDWQINGYGFFRNQSLLGNKVNGEPVVANPDLNFGQYGASVGGPIIKDKLFFFLNGEISRREDPGTNYVAKTHSGSPTFGESRVDASVMDMISQRLLDQYGYETGPYEGFIRNTDSDKILFKLDWNISDSDAFVFRYNFLNAKRDLPPHPFVLSAFGSGRGPNENSLPFQNSGYTINNNLNSWALELNSRSTGWANRAFVSFNRFRDHRDPFSAPFPTLEIAEEGVTYTTAGHEPFSISNMSSALLHDVQLAGRLLHLYSPGTRSDGPQRSHRQRGDLQHRARLSAQRGGFHLRTNLFLRTGRVRDLRAIQPDLRAAVGYAAVLHRSRGQSLL